MHWGCIFWGWSHQAVWIWTWVNKYIVSNQFNFEAGMVNTLLYCFQQNRMGKMWKPFPEVKLDCSFLEVNSDPCPIDFWMWPKIILQSSRKSPNLEKLCLGCNHPILWAYHQIWELSEILECEPWNVEHSNHHEIFSCYGVLQSHWRSIFVDT